MEKSERKFWIISPAEDIVEVMKASKAINQEIAEIPAEVIFSSQIGEVAFKEEDFLFAVLTKTTPEGWDGFFMRVGMYPSRTTCWTDEQVFRRCLEDGTAIARVCEVIRKLKYVIANPFPIH